MFSFFPSPTRHDALEPQPPRNAASRAGPSLRRADPSPSSRHFASPRARPRARAEPCRLMGLFDGLFGRGSADAKLRDQIFNLKFTAKSLARAAKKCEAEERANKVKVKRAIEKGNIDGAKIHAQDAIRKKNEGLNMLRLASRLDGVVARLETQAKMNAVNADMSGIVKSLEKSLNANNLEKVSETMDLFEKQFENLDVQTEFVEQAMGNTSALSTPPEEVASLMQQIADEHGLEFASDLPSAGTTRVTEQKQVEKDLTARLEGLKGGA